MQQNIGHIARGARWQAGTGPPVPSQAAQAAGRRAIRARVILKPTEATDRFTRLLLDTSQLLSTLGSSGAENARPQLQDHQLENLDELVHSLRPQQGPLLEMITVEQDTGVPVERMAPQPVMQVPGLDAYSERTQNARSKVLKAVLAARLRQGAPPPAAGPTELVLESSSPADLSGALTLLLQAGQHEQVCGGAVVAACVRACVLACVCVCVSVHARPCTCCDCVCVGGLPLVVSQ